LRRCHGGLGADMFLPLERLGAARPEPHRPAAGGPRDQRRALPELSAGASRQPVGGCPVRPGRPGSGTRPRSGCCMAPERKGVRIQALPDSARPTRDARRRPRRSGVGYRRCRGRRRAGAAAGQAMHDDEHRRMPAVSGEEAALGGVGLAFLVDGGTADRREAPDSRCR
jgi:hypothetical protein